MSELLKAIEAAIDALQDYRGGAGGLRQHTSPTPSIRHALSSRRHAVKERERVVAFERERLRAWNNTWRQLKEEKRER